MQYAMLSKRIFCAFLCSTTRSRRPHCSSCILITFHCKHILFDFERIINNVACLCTLVLIAFINEIHASNFIFLISKKHADDARTYFCCVINLVVLVLSISVA